MGFSWEGAPHCLTVWRNPPLKAIGFSDNRLNDDDAILIAAALESNTKLRHLVLCGRAMGRYKLKFGVWFQSCLSGRLG